MDEAEDRVGEDCGSELTSFEEILSMVGPDSVSTVTTTLAKRGFSKALLDSFAAKVQSDEGIEFTFANLRKFAESRLEAEQINTVMVVPQPLKVEISDFNFDDESADMSIPNHPSDATRGSHTVRIESTVFIDKADFRTEDSEDYFGLAPGKVVGLKYAFRVRCESVETNAAGEVVLVRVVALPDSELAEDKPKGSIQWVPASTAVPIELRAFVPIDSVEAPAELGWDAELNAESEVELSDALADPSFLGWSPEADQLFRFERVGYFVVNKDTTFGGNIILTQTVLFANYKVESDDMSVRQRTAKARQTAQVEKRKKLTSYLAPPAIPGSPGVGEGSAKASTGSGKITMAERADLARHTAGLETQAKIERMKLAKQEEFSQSTAGGNYRESARLEQEQLAQMKLDRMKQEKLAEIIPRKTSGVSFDDDGEEGPRLTPLQRKEEMKRRAEQEKQERLAEFLRKKSGSNENEGETGAIKDRFEQAKRIQQQTEEERLERIRLSRGATPSLKNVAIKDVWSDALNTNKQLSPHPASSAGAAPSGGAERAKSKWEQALNESKQSEEQRVNHTKRQTIAQFRLTDGTGFVKKRIGEWEELFVELAATVEELEQTLSAARLLSEQNELAHDLGQLHRLQKEFRDAAETPEDFELGSTRIFNIKLLDFHVAAYIKRAFQDVKTKHFALQCGVYGDQEGGKPPIDLFAAAIKADEKTMYIALTIKASPGFELDARAYGVKKVAIFSKDVNQKMLERLVNIVPQKGWEGWVAKGSYDDTGASADNDQSFVSEAQDDDRPEGESADLNEGQQAQYGVSLGSDGPEYLTNEELAELENRGDFGADGTPMRTDGAHKTRQSGDGSFVEGEDGREENYEGEEGQEADGNGGTPVLRSRASRGGASGASGGSGTGNSELDQSRSSDMSEQDDVHNVFTDIMGEDSILEGGEGEEEDSGSEAGADGEGQHARPSKAEIKSMLNRTFSASEVDEEEEEEEDDDVGDDTWKTAATPKKVRKGKDEEIVRNASMDYKFENDANDASLRFIKGEPVHDADGDEEVEYDADEDVNASTFNALKPSTVARVCLPRAFLPEHVTLEMLNNPNSKYSWSHEDEREEGLPAANHFSFNVNLQDIQNHHCSRNMLVLEGAEQCMVFTGTLKCGTSASKYILNGNKIFEWVRGAACSGWLLKWPMQSQKFGRRMRRFFVLRDHILSYHVTRPADEEEVYSNYSLSSLHITDNTTVEVGRHMFLRSLVITTPLDKLWIRMQNGNTDEATWIANINKSIQQLQRKKLFMSKVRIESKWYHESSNFHLVAVDALSLADQYIKVALFTLETPNPASDTGSMYIPPMQQYSIDIGTNIADGSALGIDGAPSTHSAKLVRPNESSDLRTSLKCLKIYGDIILLGGSNGFLGVGAMGFTSSVDAEGSPMQVMFCVPYGNNQHDPSGPNSPMRGSGDGEPSFQYPSDPSESWRSPQQKYARSGSFMMNPSGPGFPHRRTSTVVSIAAAQEAHRFVAADDEGTLSLWYFHKHNAISENLENLKTPRKMAHNSRRSMATPGSVPKRRGSEKLQVRKPMLKGVLKLSSTDPQGIYAGEKVIKMNFLMDESQLIVSTNKRLILLLLGKRADASSPKAARTPAVPAFNTPATPGSNSSNVHSDGMHTPTPIHTHDEELELGFIGWVELDRAIPGKVGLFAMHMSVNYVPAYSGAMSATIQRTITQWRITEEDQAVASRFQLSTKKKSPEGKNKCTVYRFEWTETMFSAALDQIKYF